jgi:hypothetical protein
MIINSKIIIVPHWGLGDHILSYGLVKYVSERNSEVKYLVKDCYLEIGSIIYRDLSNVSLLPLANVNRVTYFKSGWIGIDERQLQRDYPDYTIILMGCHYPGRSVDLSIYPLSFYDNLGVPRSMLWTPYNMYYSKESIEIHNEVKDISYTFIDTLSSTGHVFDANVAVARLRIDTENILTINLHKNIYPIGHRFYDICQKIMRQRLITDYACILENASYLILSDSAMFSLCHLLNIKSRNNYVICRGSETFATLYTEETYKGLKPNIRFKFTKLSL